MQFGDYGVMVAIDHANDGEPVPPTRPYPEGNIASTFTRNFSENLPMHGRTLRYGKLESTVPFSRMIHDSTSERSLRVVQIVLPNHPPRDSITSSSVLIHHNVAKLGN